MTDTMCGGKFDTGLMMRSAGSLHVSHVSRADDEESGPPEFMCHMWMRERPPPYLAQGALDPPMSFVPCDRCIVLRSMSPLAVQFMFLSLIHI